jgi:hypothetical protein
MIWTWATSFAGKQRRMDDVGRQLDDKSYALDVIHIHINSPLKQ